MFKSLPSYCKLKNQNDGLFVARLHVHERLQSLTVSGEYKTIDIFIFNYDIFKFYLTFVTVSLLRLSGRVVKFLISRNACAFDAGPTGRKIHIRHSFVHMTKKSIERVVLWSSRSVLFCNPSI